jgi:hypothetical protein
MHESHTLADRLAEVEPEALAEYRENVIAADLAVIYS